jgi:hypothetical protein
VAATGEEIVMETISNAMAINSLLHGIAYLLVPLLDRIAYLKYIKND